MYLFEGIQSGLPKRWRNKKRMDRYGHLGPINSASEIGAFTAAS
jgi:hypothetical protein